MRDNCGTSDVSPVLDNRGTNAEGGMRLKGRKSATLGELSVDRGVRMPVLRRGELRSIRLG